MPTSKPKAEGKATSPMSRPRADMADFRLTSKTEISQEAKYRARLKVEAEMRSAISAGKKQYEGKSGGQ